MIAVTAAPPEHGAEVAVDRLDDAEGDLLMAVVQDVLEMPGEQAPESQ